MKAPIKNKVQTLGAIIIICQCYENKSGRLALTNTRLVRHQIAIKMTFCSVGSNVVGLYTYGLASLNLGRK